MWGKHDPCSDCQPHSVCQTSSTAILSLCKPTLSAPTKIAKAVRKLLVTAKNVSPQEADANVWSQQGGLYTFTSIIFLYFLTCACDWDQGDGENAKDRCLELQNALKKKEGYTEEFTDVSTNSQIFLLYE